MPNAKHRPEIDGLRAVAVILVLGFHAFPNALPGGFIAVDFFFVISGYLQLQKPFANRHDGTAPGLPNHHYSISRSHRLIDRASVLNRYFDGIRDHAPTTAMN
jgi:peptidoglycan/LPS O-acetylase OafA/YrhL